MRVIFGLWSSNTQKALATMYIRQGQTNDVHRLNLDLTMFQRDKSHKENVSNIKRTPRKKDEEEWLPYWITCQNLTLNRVQLHTTQKNFKFPPSSGVRTHFPGFFLGYFIILKPKSRQN